MADISKIKLPDGTTYSIKSSKVWEGTQAQYNAIVTKDPETTYFITDGGTGSVIHLNDISDVDIANTPTTGELISYDATTGTWKNSGSNADISVKSITCETTHNNLRPYITSVTDIDNNYATSAINLGYTLAGLSPSPGMEIKNVINRETWKGRSFIVLRPYGEDTEIVLPHKYSMGEQVVGYWIDGSPVYEKTLQFDTAKTINADSYISVPTTMFAIPSQPIDIVCYSTPEIHPNGSAIVWRCVLAQINPTTGAMNIHSTRNASIVFDTFTIKYVKIT